MSDRLTDNARTAMALANREAVRHNHECISSEHILLGVLGSQRSTVAKVLGSLQLTVTQLRDAIAASAPREVTERTPMAKRIVLEALVQAGNLQHTQIGSGHLLLAILSMPECDAARRLQQLGHQLSDVRSRTLSLMISLDESEVPKGERDSAETRVQDLEERVQRLEDTIITLFREIARLRRERAEDV